MNTTDDYTEILDELLHKIDAGIKALVSAAHHEAEAEREYRKAKAQLWVAAPSGTAGSREAWVDGESADLRYQRDLAAGTRQAALEALRSRRAQLSAVQTRLNAHREEAGFERTRP